MKKALAAIFVLAMLVGAACEEPGEPDPGGTSTTTTEVSSTTSTTDEPTSTTRATTSTTLATTTTTVQPILGYVGIYPFSNSVQADAGSDAWEDPVFTAQKFLTEYVGFTRLIMGQFQQGDSRSGEVTATTRTNGFVTTVFVRKIGTGNNWTVVGASTNNIQISKPQPLQTVVSPTSLAGQSIAFEGTVLFDMRQDGQYDEDGELGFAVITGHGTEMGPFSGQITFERPTVDSGALVAFTESAEDGHIQEVTAVKVRF